MKKYEELTPEQKKEICNGCGGKGSFITPPHAIFFHASCNHHDYGYWKGCTEKDRLDCDEKFYAAMIEDCKTLNWFEYARYRPWAWLYYKAVRAFGGNYFYYAKEKREVT
jgi:hypothetical protein